MGYKFQETLRVNIFFKYHMLDAWLLLALLNEWHYNSSFYWWAHHEILKLNEYFFDKQLIVNTTSIQIFENQLKCTILIYPKQESHLVLGILKMWITLTICHFLHCSVHCSTILILQYELMFHETKILT